MFFLFSWHLYRQGELTMLSVSSFSSSHLSFTIYFLSAVSNFFNLLLLFIQSSPTLFRALLVQSPIAISVTLASISPPLSGLSSFIFISHSTSTYSRQFLLKTFLHSSLHSHFINYSLTSSSPLRFLLTGYFRQPGPSPVVSMPG